jgi:hypothetical protein
VAASGKLALLDHMMGRLRCGGHRVLIYSQFTRTLDVLEDWVRGRGWGYERIDGERLLAFIVPLHAAVLDSQAQRRPGLRQAGAITLAMHTACDQL